MSREMGPWQNLIALTIALVGPVAIAAGEKRAFKLPAGRPESRGDREE